MKTGLGDLEEFPETQQDRFGLGRDGVVRSPQQDQQENGHGRRADEPQWRLRKIHVYDCGRLIVHSASGRKLEQK
jgi:hypothetical protein